MHKASTTPPGAQRPAPATDEKILWQGYPAQPRPRPASEHPAPHYVITLASAAGTGVLWVMLPDFPALRNGLLAPIVILLVLAAYPALARHRRNRQFMASTYMLTTRQAILEHKGQITRLALTPDTRLHLSEAPFPTLTLWNPTEKPRAAPLHFEQLADGAAAHEIARIYLQSLKQPEHTTPPGGQ